MSAPRPSRHRRPPGRRPNRRPARPHLEQVEPRTLLATFLVTNSDDAGAGSFRQALLDSNAMPGFDTINFDADGGFDLVFVRLDSPLPDVTDPVLIDGTTQPGFNLSEGDLFEIDGGRLDGADGLVVRAGGTTILGLSIVDFDGVGVIFSGPGGNRLDQSRIGNAEFGDEGNESGGVLIDGSSNNTIGGSAGTGNIISSNGEAGIRLDNAPSNLVAGNLIGVAPTRSGIQPAPNGEANFDGTPDPFGPGGIQVEGSLSTGNTIGGTSRRAANVVSANNGPGIALTDGATGNLVAGNLVGTDADGSAASNFGNAGFGIDLDGAGRNNTIGGSGAGNGFGAVAGSIETLTFASTSPLPQMIPDDSPAGVVATIPVSGFSAGFQVTDLDVTLDITHPFVSDLVVRLIAPSGVAVTLAADVGGSGNDFDRTIFDDEAALSIGVGDPPFTGRFRPLEPLSRFDGEPTTGDWRLEVEDTEPVDRGTLNSVSLTIQAGVLPPRDGNVISGNGRGGLRVAGDGGNRIQGNRIGTDTTGTKALPNRGAGMVIESPDNLVGGTISGATAGAGNLISGNAGAGILIDFGGEDNRIEGNTIGTDLGGTVALGNAGDGVRIEDAAGNTVGGTLAVGAGSGATIVSAAGLPVRVPPVGSGGSGIDAQDVTRAPLIVGGFGATDTITDLDVNLSITHTWDGDLDIILIAPDGTRITLSDDNGDSGDNYFDTTFDDQASISITAAAASPPFTGRFRPEGPLSALNGRSPNGTWTLEVRDEAGGDVGTLDAFSLVITTGGGAVVTADPTFNVIAGNGTGVGRGSGVVIDGSARGNLVAGNLIGASFNRANLAPVALGNTGDGVRVDGAVDNTIGGAGTAGNVIGANGVQGLNDVAVTGTGRGVALINGASSNLVAGNFIGAGDPSIGFATPILDLSNLADGVAVIDSPDNVIGLGPLGVAIGGGNVITANNASGVLVRGVGSARTVVAGNRIGADASGSTARGNALDGVTLDGATSVTVGGAATGFGNTIVANGRHGVRIFSSIRGPGNTPIPATANVVLGNAIGGPLTPDRDLRNRGDGVSIEDATNNTIGGADADPSTPGNPAGNAILFNARNGVQIAGATASGNAVLGNFIRSNDLDGLLIQEGSRNVVGGGAGAGNLVENNGGNGVRVRSLDPASVSARSNAVLGNTLTRNRQNGLFLEDADENTVGLARVPGLSAPITFAAQGLPRPVPSAGTGGADTTNDFTTATVVVTQAGPIRDLDVTLNLPHSFVSDLVVTLIAPDGTRILLISDDQFDRTAGLLGTIFDDEATRSIVVATDPFTGRFRPEEPLSLLDGREAGGVWTLEVEDRVGGDVGQLTAFALTLRLALPPTDVLSRNVVNDNNGNGIVVRGQRNLLVGNLVGTDAAGAAIVDPRGPIGNDQVGILIESNLDAATPRPSFGNTIGGTAPGERNVVSGNLGSGIEVRNAPRNLIQGNLVGTDLTGTRNLGNTNIGISILTAGGARAADTAADSNTVGGTTAAARNVVLGSGGSGIQINSSQSNLVQGNYIGLTADGRFVADPATGRPLGNFQDGVSLVDSRFNTIGGAAPGARNVISGNLRNGVAITVNSFDFDDGGQFFSDQANVVQGNFIGTDAGGSFDLGNALIGVFVQTQGNLIGGANPDPAVPTAGNVISGNDLNGIALEGRLARFNRIEGNFVGTNAAGSSIAGAAPGGVLRTLGNAQAGVFLNDAPGNTIGGTAAGARNVISGNLAAGIQLFDGNDRSDARAVDGPTGAVLARPVGGTLIRGNIIGLDALAAVDLGNSGNGIFLNEARGNTIGGPAPAPGAPDPGNLIGGNDGSGIEVLEAEGGVASRAGGRGNLIERNLIGVDATARSDRGNNLNGIFINQAPNNTIAGNVSAANNGFGILIGGGTAIGNRVVGNAIGVPSPDPSRPNGLGNALDGINLTGVNPAGANPGGPQGVLIGGPGPFDGNVIAFNGGDGVEFFNSFGNALVGANSIHTNGGDGVRITDASRNSIDRGTVIRDNAINGVEIVGTSTGTVILGAAIVQNRQAGVLVYGTGAAVNDEALRTRVLDSTISGNAGAGVEVRGSSPGLELRGNRLGTDAAGVAALPNQDGLFLNNIVGAGLPTVVVGNLIAGNLNNGVRIFQLDPGPIALIENNRIGTAADGLSALPGDGTGRLPGRIQQVGVLLDDAPGHVVRNNLISANDRAGVLVSGQAALGNQIANNTIGGAVGGGPLAGEIVRPLFVIADQPNVPIGRRSVAVQGLGVRQDRGILLEDTRNAVVMLNTLTGNETGIEIVGANSTANVAAFNTLSVNFVGVAIDGASGNFLVSNVVAGQPVVGEGGLGSTSIGIQVTRGSAVGNVIQGNFIQNMRGFINVVARANLPGEAVDAVLPLIRIGAAVPVGTGIYIETAQENQVVGNTIVNSRLVGAYLFGGADNNVLSRNTFDGNDDYSILLFNSSGNVAEAGRSANFFRGQGPVIANFREFTGGAGPRLGTVQSALLAQNNPSFIPVQTPRPPRRVARGRRANPPGQPLPPSQV